MSRHIRTKVANWQIRIEPDGLAHAELHYDKYDGRGLSLTGESNLSIDGEALVDTEIGLHSGRSKEAAEIDCRGFAKLWPAERGRSRLLGVSIDLPPALWRELWYRAHNPPPAVWVGFTVPGVDADTIGTAFPTGIRLPILSPYVSLNTN